MTEKTDTQQLRFWRGDFGRDYIERNEVDPKAIEALVPVWQRMLAPAVPKPRTILEVGCNIGLNLRALPRVTDAKLFAVEPNAEARKRVIRDQVLSELNIQDGIAARIPLPDNAVDLAFTSGVLIHVHPDQLADSCREIFRVSARHILCAEYYSAQPREISYRGQSGLLFLRDFGAFWMQTCPSLKLVDYGFFWTGAGAPDNLNWWLFSRE